MRKLTLYLFIFCSSFMVCRAQINGPTTKQWDARFGGSNYELLSVLQQTKDGGFILAGSTNSDSSGDVSQHNLGAANTNDYWVVKTDSLGNKLWDKRYGGNKADNLYAVIETPDGGYLFGGLTNSDSGGSVSQPSKGGSDFWIVKADSAGNKLWDKRYGGKIDDVLTSMQRTSDGGFILGGYTDSDSGKDVSQHPFGPAYTNDYWVVKIDSLGNKQWDKRFGGDNNDNLYYVQQTADGGFILGGTTSSDSSGTVSQFPLGTTDYWLVKTDAIGNKFWDQRLGGNGDNEFYSMQQTPGGGYILGGTTTAGPGGDVSLPAFGAADYWVVKTDTAGNKLWDKRYGGTGKEFQYGNVSLTADGGYLFSCASASDSSGNKTQNDLGPEQSWLIKTDSLGNKLWDKTIFTTGTDLAGYAIMTTDGGYAIANYTNAGIGGYKTQASRGSYDYWLTKFNSLGAQCNLAAPTIVAGGNTTFCSGDSIQVCASASFPFYQWSCNGIDSCVFVKDSGDCYLVVMDVNNCIAESNHIHITWRPVTGNSISAAKTFVCSYDSTSICVNSAFVSYRWNTGDTGTCIAGYGGYSYYVLVTDSNNCTALSNTVNLTDDSVPAFTITAGRTTFCQGDTTGICAPPGFFFYYWSSDEEGTCISVTDSGNYLVTVTDNFGCTAQSNQVYIDVKPVPVISIIQHGDSLFYTGSLPCQWYSLGQPLPGETHSLYVIRAPGSYTLLVSDTNGCSATSAAYSLTGVPNLTGNETVEVYPNPSTGQLFIETGNWSPGLISLFNLNGQKISEQKFRQQLDISELPPGIYFVEINAGDVVARKKVVKL